jgi:hypothetical protein
MFEIVGGLMLKGLESWLAKMKADFTFEQEQKYYVY